MIEEVGGGIQPGGACDHGVMLGLHPAMLLTSSVGMDLGWLLSEQSCSQGITFLSDWLLFL